MKLILGSKSPGRRKLFEEAGLEFEVMPADIDEKAIRTDDYELLPQLIAKAKNDALAKLISEPAILVTADTVQIFRGALREKPESEAQAREYLKSYEPTTPSTTVSAIVVTNLQTGKQAAGFSKADVYFKPFDDEAIDRFIADGYIMGAAGGFAIELPEFQPYIYHVDGDPETVMGISTELAKQLIAEVTT